MLYKAEIETSLILMQHLRDFKRRSETNQRVTSHKTSLCCLLAGKLIGGMTKQSLHLKFLFVLSVFLLQYKL